MIKPILSIIIVSYNTSRLTTDCLKSIALDKNIDLNLIDNNQKIPTEIIIVDNNSTDDSTSQIKNLNIPTTLIENKNNKGFGQANNQAVSIAQGNYLLLLNSDTVILHSAVSQSLDWLASHPESWGCTAQLLNSNKTIQASGGYFPNLLNIFTWSLHLDDLPLVNTLIPPFHPHTPDFYTKDSYYLNDHSQDWLTGAFMLIRKEVFDQVKGFNEKFFMYGEEMEMCYRIQKKFPSLTANYLVGPQIIHLGGASSTNKNTPLDREYEGILKFFELHRPHWQLPIIKLLLKINRFLRVQKN